MPKENTPGDERTSCCNAYTTWLDDGHGNPTLCCRACYEEVHAVLEDGERIWYNNLTPVPCAVRKES